LDFGIVAEIEQSFGMKQYRAGGWKDGVKKAATREKSQSRSGCG
jgi:hypothetical protein